MKVKSPIQEELEENKTEDIQELEENIEETDTNTQEPIDEQAPKEETITFQSHISIKDDSVIHSRKKDLEYEKDGSKITVYDEPNFKTDKIVVKVQFPKSSPIIECVITATGYKDRVVASGGELRLLQNRLYFVPVNTDANSDEYSHIKVMSDISDSIDVRYIKEGLACIIPLKHNVKIYNNIRIAVLS